MSAITKTPGVCGGKACIGGTRIPVWGIENWRRMAMSEVAVLLRYPSITAAQLRAAWLYADDHQEEIDQQIQENYG